MALLPAPTPIPDPLSSVALPTSVMYEKHVISTATSFCYAYKGAVFLVTNWHVVSGRDPITLQPLDKVHAAIPDRLGVTFAIAKPVGNNMNHIFWYEVPLPLYEDDERKNAVWLEHPVHGHGVDVAVIPLSGFEKSFKITSANDAAHDLVKLRLFPGSDVYVLGFPLGLTGGGQFPIWKRGTIASEPGIDLDGMPKLHIDTATRKGMSGAPVYAQQVGLIVPEDPNDPAKGSLGRARRFLGVYASRLDGDEFSAQLGVVWKEAAIEQIVDGKKRGTSSFELTVRES